MRYEKVLKGKRISVVFDGVNYVGVIKPFIVVGKSLDKVLNVDWV
jgi:hypothetical protein